MKKVSLLIPCYNEQDVLPLLYARVTAVIDALPGYNWEVLFVNDGSTDGTLDILRDLHARDKRMSYVDLSRNFGKEKAMLAGFDCVTGDAMIILDADLQDPPELIPDMLALWEQGFDDVYARRRSRAGESAVKKATSRLFYKLLQSTTTIPIQRDTGDFRLLDKRCITALRQLRESERYTKGFFSWIGYNKTEILFDRDPRAAGSTKWNYRKLIGLAVDGFVTFTTAPLRWATFLGVLVSLAAFAYMVFFFIRTLVEGNPVDGYPSLLTIVLFLGGVQLLSIGILGEYIAVIFSETKRRPPYLVKEHSEPRNI
jgi:glycosyltransferase involved in cell wall biosynthesis